MEKKKKKIRYAVVGLGHIAQTAMLPGFDRAANSVVTAFVSDDSVKLKKLGKKHGVDHTYAYEDYEACLMSGEIDAVYIATPNYTHRALAEQAAACGIHVLCEKPLAVDESSCRSMVEIARRNKIKLMTAYRLHFDAANLEAIEIAQSGKLGDLRYFNSSFSMQVEDENNIRLDPPRLGGGPVFDIGIYCINAARNIFRSEPFEVVAMASDTGDRRFKQTPEMTSAVLSFPGGRLASFTVSFGAADASTFEIVGTKSRLRLENAYDYASPMKLQLINGEKSKTREFRKKDQFASELVYFSDCVLKNREPEPSGLEGLADVRIIEALHRSIDERRVVRLNESRLPVKSKWPTIRQKIERPALDRPPKAIHAKQPSSH